MKEDRAMDSYLTAEIEREGDSYGMEGEGEKEGQREREGKKKIDRERA